MQQSCEQRSLAVSLKDSPEGKQKLATELYRRFHAMKTYGKEPESLENIISVFTSDLEEFPTENILKAIKTHSQRSQEFPTVSDIIGLLKRNGRPPMDKAIYVTISKKDYEDRANEERRYMRDYEEQMQEEWEGSDPCQQAVRVEALGAYKITIMQLREEIEKLNQLLHETRMAKGLDRPKSAMEEKVKNTIAMMKSCGSTIEEVEEFLVSIGLPRTYESV